MIFTLCIEFIMAVFATGAFAVLFNAPKDQWLYAGLTGGIGLIFYRCLNSPLGAPIATFVAVLVLTLLSRIFAILRKAPVTIFLVCGIFPLVPGVGIYYTSYHFIMGQAVQAGSYGMETIKIAIAIALGIMFVLSIPQKWFRLLFRK